MQVLDFYMEVCVSAIGNYENPTQIQIILTVELGNVSTSQLSEHRVEKFEGHQYIFNKARNHSCIEKKPWNIKFGLLS